jgi:ATP-dependent RNA helicase HrpB
VPADLPIRQIEADITSALREHHRLVVVAPTGSGKSTQIPQMLLESGLGGEGRIVVLQPRRVAARSVAARVAWERRVRLGHEVGYQIRFDDQTSLGTRICFVTEGILVRWLQENPALGGIGAVLFDEFHERNLISDVALALVKKIQSRDRSDLNVVVMSATLEAEPVAQFLDGCPVLSSKGQMFPVEVKFLVRPDPRPLADQAAERVGQIVNAGLPGDILVFMPGMGEINATLNALRGIRIPERLAMLPLHGELPPEIQDQAFASNPLRKVVVATNVAETSVTIDGIRHVVDSGWARVARFDAERGIGTLFLEEISRASAEQRQGRAGRTAPGTCHRLWTESGHLNRPERNTPEIQRTDLAEVVLLLHALHIKNAAAFDWLDAPDRLAVERAESLLRILGALEETTGELTSIGQQMRRLPMHPRFSRMLVEAQRQGCLESAALCAALVSGRDLLVRLGREDQHLARARDQFEVSPDSDFFTLLRGFHFARDHQFSLEACRRHGLHAQTARQIEQTYEQIRRIVSLPAEGRAEESPESAGLLKCIMAGFIDQLCKRRDGGTLECDLTEGRHGTLVRESVVQKAPLFVAAGIREVSTRSAETLTLLSLASAVQESWISEMFPAQLTSGVEHQYDRTHKRVAVLRVYRFQDLVLRQEHLPAPDPAAAGRCLADAHRQGAFELPLFNHEIKQFIARVNLIVTVLPELEFPSFDEEAIRQCLARALHGCHLAKEAQTKPVREAFLDRLAREQREWLDELAPSALNGPDGRRLKLTYPDSPAAKDGALNPPEIQIKLRECFSLTEHPRIAEGKLPVKLWLGAPDGKRLDSTLDWPEFKSQVYPKLKPVLLRKYPGTSWL